MRIRWRIFGITVSSIVIDLHDRLEETWEWADDEEPY